MRSCVRASGLSHLTRFVPTKVWAVTDTETRNEPVSAERIKRRMTVKDVTLAVVVAGVGALAAAAPILDLSSPHSEPLYDHNAMHVRAMFRIDPDETRRVAQAATYDCLRDLLPADRREMGFVSSYLVDAYIARLAHHTSWRTDMDLAAFEKEANAIGVSTQQRYNDTFQAMTDAERADAMTVRQKIVSGADPWNCIYKRTAAQARRIIASPEPDTMVGLRGTMALR